MAVSTERVTWPVGVIDPDVYWPDVLESDWSDWVEGWIKDGKARATALGLTGDKLDQYTIQWVYYRAADGKYTDLLGAPASVSDAEDGSSSFLADQIDAWRIRAEAALAAAQAVVDSLTASLGPITERSRSVDLIFGL